MKGEVVGINSQIYSRTGGFMGLSFAIPIDIAMDVQNQLRTQGRVSRGRIGVVIQEVTKDLADSFGVAKAQGALVNSVEKGGPADRAGIEAGDIILKFDGKSVAQSSDLPRIVGATRPGARSVVQVFRKGTLRDFNVVVAEIPDDKPATPRKSRTGKSETPANRLGLVLSEPTAEQRREMGVESGVVVEEIKANGVRTELRTGDVILAIIIKGATIEVKSVEQFNKQVASVDKSQTLTLLVRRGEMQTFVTIKAVGDK
jgi:serine protease Do